MTGTSWSPCPTRDVQRELATAQEQYALYVQLSELAQSTWAQPREVIPAAQQPVGFFIRQHS